MRKFIALVLGLGLVFAFDASAQTSDKTRAEWKADATSIDTKHLIGMKVRTPDGKHAGEIDQLVVSMNDGKITHAVIGVGGLAGVGERHVVVPWSKVKLGRDAKDRDEMAATIEQSALDAAPRYTRASTDRIDRAPAASPGTAPSADRDRDGMKNRSDRQPDNPKKY